MMDNLGFSVGNTEFERIMVNCKLVMIYICLKKLPFMVTPGL